MMNSHLAQLVLVLALIVDLFLGEYNVKIHPVIYMGNYIKFLWGRRPSHTENSLFIWGIFLVLSGNIIFFIIPYFVLLPSKGFMTALLSVLLLKPAFALKELIKSAREVRSNLASGNLEEARHLTSLHLVSRNTKNLSKEEICGAVIESISENLTDSFVSPLFYFAIAGIPGAWVYRFSNTCDSLIAYKYGDYEQGGKFAAKFDDFLNWLPARISGYLLIFAAELNGFNGRNARDIMLKFHRNTSSPNAGWTMSAMAGALNIPLSKAGEYFLPGGKEQLDFHFIDSAVRIVITAAGFYIFFVLAFLEVLL